MIDRVPDEIIDETLRHHFCIRENCDPLDDNPYGGPDGHELAINEMAEQWFVAACWELKELRAQQKTPTAATAGVGPAGESPATE